MRAQFLLLILVPLSGGCTSIALQRHTIGQIETTTDLRYKEVLNNLALLSDNPHSIPAYSVMLSGTTKTLDQASITSATNIGREAVGMLGSTITHFQSESLDTPIQRGISDNWVLDPVTSPEKLKAIRMACWWVLYGQEAAIEKENVHLGPKPKDDLLTRNDKGKWGYYFAVAEDLRNLPLGWLHCGELKECPRNAIYKARSHDKCVWVTSEGLEGLTQFSLILQNLSRQVTDTAYYPAAIARTVTYTKTSPDGKVLTYTFIVDENGFPLSDATAHALPVKKRLETIVNDPSLKSQIAASSSGR